RSCRVPNPGVRHAGAVECPNVADESGSSQNTGRNRSLSDKVDFPEFVAVVGLRSKGVAAGKVGSCGVGLRNQNSGTGDKGTIQVDNQSAAQAAGCVIRI